MTMLKLSRGFWFAGLLLLPFSTSAGEGSVVVNYGLPFFLLASLFSFISIVLYKLKIIRRLQLFVAFTFLALCSVLLHTLLAPNIAASSARTIYNVFGFVLLLFVVGVELHSADLQDTGVFNNYSLMIMLSGLVLATYYIINLVSVVLSSGNVMIIFFERGTGRALSLPWGASNIIAASLLIPLYATLCRWTIKSKKHRRLESIAIIVMCAAILLTLSRNAAISVIFGFLLIAILLRQFKILLFIFFVSACTFVVANMVLEPEQLSALINSRLTNNDSLSSLNGRIEIWSASLAYLTNHLLMPIGYYGSQYVLMSTSHNFILTTLLEQGFGGLVIWLMLFGSAFIYLSLFMSRRSRVRRPATVLFCGLAAVFLDLQFEDPNFANPHAIYFWMYLALICLVPFSMPVVTQVSTRVKQARLQREVQPIAQTQV
jgi:O-antigen ligase